MLRRFKPFLKSFAAHKQHLSTTSNNVSLFNKDVPLSANSLIGTKEKNLSSKSWTYKYYSELGLFRNWSVCSIDSPQFEVLSHVTDAES